ncbi:PEPxxWA-CTERM sorting domain-containing protein [Sphingomonas sp. PAMC 26617]|uniref:PEPxxWA-CTERM sorting domain-containing protein n=1 Tax=Sphingomonas sp. PAMC 26617 TaxID=1112216 RepID=UPI001E320181|nr:PEPxxWA-CTERM sorting domain-containing protein [Sphingomonas sp. PAMC 26617]
MKLIRNMCGVAAFLLCANAAQAATITVNSTTSGQDTAEFVNGRWQLKTQGMTFLGDGPTIIFGNSIKTFDGTIFDEGRGEVVFDSVDFVVRSLTFDLSRIHTGISCPITSITDCNTDNHIIATAYDITGKIIASVDSLNPFYAFRATSDIGIARLDWSGITPTTRYDPQPYANGSLISNLTLTDVVPEPATWAMMLIGFGIVGASARRARNHTVRFAYT